MKVEENECRISFTLKFNVSVLRFFATFKSQRSKTHRIFLHEVDMMSFEILSNCKSFEILDFAIDNIIEVLKIMNQLNETRKTSTIIKNFRHSSFASTCLFEFSNLISLTTSMLRFRESKIIELLKSAKHCDELISHKIGFVIFHHRLKIYVRIVEIKKQAVFEQIKRILQQYKYVITYRE